MASGGLSAAESIAANGGTVATRHASVVAAAATANRTSCRTVLTLATARITNANAAVANHRTRQNVATTSTSTSAVHISSADTAATTIGTWTTSCSVSNNNQPSWTPQLYMADIPVGVPRLLTNIPEAELGDCPESKSDDEEEDLSKGFYVNPHVGGDLWTTRADAFENRESRDVSDDSADFTVARSRCLEPSRFVLEI
jgi:hypothetical protein